MFFLIIFQSFSLELCIAFSYFQSKLFKNPILLHFYKYSYLSAARIIYLVETVAYYSDNVVWKERELLKIITSMNKYEILERIGQGEYGVVLKGRNKETGELVAIKKFKEDDTDQENKRVILRQVKILKTLSHENIIELKQAFRKKGRIYLVCQYVEKNLLEMLEEGPFTPAQVRQYAFGLLKGIAYMHSLNVIHRDVKPQNVLVGRQGAIKICDLGFARSIPSNRIMTDYVATRWYRPPQLLIGRDDYDKSIDIWSIGCVLAQSIDGEPLFPGENDLDQLYLIQKCLGPLTAQHQEHFLKNPKFIGMKFPEIHNLQTIQRRYFGKIDKQGLDLLKRMLKMDPKQRITAEQALNHPFFQRAGSVSQVQAKKSKAECYDDAAQREFHPNHSNNLLINQKSPLPLNNFLQDKTLPKDEKIGTNKVTGLLKLKKAAADNLSVIRQNHMTRDEQPQFKGKSVGSKKVQAKYGPLTDKKNRGTLKSRVEVPKHQNDADLDEYYEQKWQQEGNEQVLNHKKDRFTKEKDVDPSPKKEQLRKSKILSKNYRKDNFNIVFNNNTYNLNIVDPFN